MILWRNFHFLSFNTNTIFPLFLLYVMCKSGVTFVRRYFRDEGADQLRRKICFLVFAHNAKSRFTHDDAAHSSQNLKLIMTHKHSCNAGVTLSRG